MQNWKENLGLGLARQMLGADLAIKRRTVKTGTVHRLFQTDGMSRDVGETSFEVAQRIVEAYADFLALA